MRQSVLIGNWKMHNPLPAFATFWAQQKGDGPAHVHMVICPPALVLAAAQAAGEDRSLAWGAQAIASIQTGARTGDLSAQMWHATGAAYCLVGHSERRLYHKETNRDAALQLQAAWEGGLIPILCIGEDLAMREAGQTLDVLAGQLAETLPDVMGGPFMIAYEPLWAIGTGKIPNLDELEVVFKGLHALLARHPQGVPPLLYGGSVTSENAHDLWRIPHLSGLLVGGASLDPAAFYAIAEKAPQREGSC